MARLNRNNIDRKTNKPNPKNTESLLNDQMLNRADQTRRDDDVIRTPKRTLYDIDYAMKWYIENEIQPQVTANKNLIPVPVIFSSGEKWDNVRRLGYIRDLMMWCDFTTQLNDLIDQILPFSRYAWGNEGNKFTSILGAINFETVNSVGEDRLVRATIPLTVKGTLLSEQETRLETVKKMYSVKKVSYDTKLNDETTTPSVSGSVNSQDVHEE